MVGGSTNTSFPCMSSGLAQLVASGGCSGADPHSRYQSEIPGDTRCSSGAFSLQSSLLSRNSSYLCLPKLHSLPPLRRPPGCAWAPLWSAEDSRQKAGEERAHLPCFPALRSRRPVLPIVQHMQNVVSCSLSFWLMTKRQIQLCLFYHLKSYFFL